MAGAGDPGKVRHARGGSIPDLGEAVGGPCRITSDARTRRLVDLVPVVPTPMWGHDEEATGEGWNSNSVIAWLIAATGLPTDGPAAAAPGARSGPGRGPRPGDA